MLTQTLRALRRPIIPSYASLSTRSTTDASSSSRDAGANRPNGRILAALHQARTAEENRPDRNRYRIRALNKAIQEIGYLEYSLVDVKDMEELKGISPGLRRALGKLVRMQNPLIGYLDFVELEDESNMDTNANGKGRSKDDATIRAETKSQRARDKERARIAGELQSVPGLGLTTAKELVSLGVESVQQLRESIFEDSKNHNKPGSAQLSLNFSSHLTQMQLTNLKYLPHLIQPVTRDEVSRILTLLRAVLPSHFQIIPTGAYRRGFPISQRIDVCLFHPLFHPEVKDVPVPSAPSVSFHDFLTFENLERRGRVDLAFRSQFTRSSVKNSSIFLNEVIPALKAGGLVAQDGLAELSVGQWKWSGIVRVPELKHTEEADTPNDNNTLDKSPFGSSGNLESQVELESLKSRLRALRTNTGTFRKLDLSIAPLHSRATALLFLTGDVEFVRDMRMRARRMGMVLNEFGLWTWDGYEEEGGKTEEGRQDGGNEEQEEQENDNSQIKRGPGRPRLSPKPHDLGRSNWTLIPTPNEQSLFASLGLDYIPPEKRNYSFLLSKYHKVGGKQRRGGEEGAGVGVVLKS
ncbi:hypothetical protein F5050DRAFT_58600 [Lentinula boryana]|uniref:DNA-directed DNA polymerase X domain-containing protein n=1 Tax=Lentinula boryana TaxID=40481 RepID=A0ABQ8QDW7_9AGAR|nr:hypothetical protein F5050DRAFT_58600 [Lentinula boryana]